MSRNLDSNNKTVPIKIRALTRMLFNGSLYSENNGLGPKMIRDTNFVEYIHYGLIDHENNSIIPKEEYIVNTEHGRVFDFVADSYSLMRLNWNTAIQKNLISTEGSSFGNLRMYDSYKNPRIRYGEYLGNILQFYNKTHIPNNIGIINITSYEDYVNYFFDFIFKNSTNIPITMTRWNTSRFSSVLDTGLAFSYAKIKYDADQRKVDELVDHPCNTYFKNLSLNMGFNILHNTPNILLYDVASPANEGIKLSYGLWNLNSFFGKRFIKTYTIDNELLYNNINIYYNKFVDKNRRTKVVKVIWNGTCNKTTADFVVLQPVDFTTRPFSDINELKMYCSLRNIEEGKPFSDQKVNNIFKKSKFFLKSVDKTEAMSYINSEFKDQVWNKDHGFHDLTEKFRGETKTQAQRDQVGAVPSRQQSSSPSTGGGGSSGGSSY